MTQIPLSRSKGHQYSGEFLSLAASVIAIACVIVFSNEINRDGELEMEVNLQGRVNSMADCVRR